MDVRGEDYREADLALGYSGYHTGAGRGTVTGSSRTHVINQVETHKLVFNDMVESIMERKDNTEKKR